MMWLEASPERVVSLQLELAWDDQGKAAIVHGLGYRPPPSPDPKYRPLISDKRL